MQLNDKITRLRELFAQRDGIDQQIAAMLGDAEIQVPAKKFLRATKKAARGKPIMTGDANRDAIIADIQSGDMKPAAIAEKHGIDVSKVYSIKNYYLKNKGATPTDSAVMNEASGRHPETARIEEMLIAGSKAPQIMEVIEVSAPVIYAIKARLKKDYRLTE